jgi:hypothetical protein
MPRDLLDRTDTLRTGANEALAELAKLDRRPLFFPSDRLASGVATALLITTAAIVAMATAAVV